MLLMVWRVRIDPREAFDYRKGSHQQLIDHHQAPTVGLESKLSLSITVYEAS